MVMLTTYLIRWLSICYNSWKLIARLDALDYKNVALCAFVPSIAPTLSTLCTMDIFTSSPHISALRQLKNVQGCYLITALSKHSD